jgi:AraC family transcriptional regulator, positive regulator of tynA and feaB
MFSSFALGPTMQQIFSTADLHQRDRFDCWHEVACKNILGHESRPQSRQTFEAELSVACIAQMDLLLFRNSAMQVQRTSRHIESARHDDLFVCLQRASCTGIAQAGRELALQPSDFCLLDPRLPHTATFDSNSEMLCFKIPRSMLEARIGYTHRVALRSLGKDSAVGRFTSQYLASLPAHADLFEAGHELIREQALDLIALSLGAATNEQASTVSASRALHLLTLRSAIEARLQDASLTPVEAAAATGISVRYANALLAEQGTSLGRYIQDLRLERCRKILEDPTQAHRTLTEIAFAWGFSDQSHFSRAFKSAYGVTPREFRLKSE